MEKFRIIPIRIFVGNRFVIYEDKFENFTKDDLKNYTRFKEILISFKKFYNIDQYNLKDIDRYLWQLGKEYFPKNY